MKKVIFAACVAGAFAMTSCGGGNALVTKGSTSQFDSLSYSVGVNLASMINTQLGDIPIDEDVMIKSVSQAASGKSKITHEEVAEILQDYFMNKREARGMEIEATRDKADSVAIANGADRNAVREARQNLPADPAMFENNAERKLISTYLGYDLGNSIITAKLPVQTVWVERAFKDIFAEKDEDLKMTVVETNAYLQKYFTEIIPAQNQTASEEWLASIEKQSGIQKTESGILYKIEVEGSELKATDDRDRVRVKYTGKSRTGEVFDSSRFEDMASDRLEYLKSRSEDGSLSEEDEIVEFALSQVIKGWTEGMKLVGVGGRISLWLPSELAYGSRGAGGQIGANEALYFDVELVDVIPFVEEPTAE